MPRLWAIALTVVVQVGILAVIPARAILARSDGVKITLRTRPFDPYDAFVGYHERLAYEVEFPPPAEGFKEGEPVWITVEKADPAWTLVSVTREKPPAAPDRVPIRAAYGKSRCVLEGAGVVYVPESRREEADRKMREAEGKALVDLLIDKRGTAYVLRLRVGPTTFGE